jgi:sugar transferase EpsL
MYRRRLKRAIDLAFAIALGIVLSPVLVLVALAVRLILGPPILFRQQRPGLHGRSFTLVKFRTMREQRSRDGRDLPDATRLHPFGAVLRSTSLDELPELWNVLRGDMSLVGPRPLLMQYLERYSREQARRHEVRPGMTGLAQVSGRNGLSWEEKFRLDVEYVDECSFVLDATILVATAWHVLARRGINQPGHSTAEEFMGTPSQ